MATRKLWLHHCLLALSLGLLVMLSSACNEERPLGVTLLFLNVGSEPIGVKRFDPDGRRGPVPGALGRGGGKQMAFMAGDSEHGVPRFVEAGWTIPNAEYRAWSAEMSNKPVNERYSAQNREDYQRLWNNNQRHTRRIDLTPIITPELVAQVRADPQSTHLKLTVTFKDDDVSIAAEAYRWRKAPANRD